MRNETNKDLLSYLEIDYNKNIRDPLWKDIKLNKSIYRIYKSKEVQKLSRIKQLGPTNLVYPGAMHTRLCHSLGVYHLSRMIIISLLSKENCPKLSREGIDSFLAAALLHDIGHYPYTHSLKELPLVDHEILATKIINSNSELNKVLLEEKFSISSICNILDFKSTPINDEIKIYKSLLSGALDPDKLDYLNRDAFFAGVTYGLQDCSYIISHLTIFDGQSALMESAKTSLEHLLFAKYQMYKTVYWHKKTRCATAMIKKTLIYNLNNNYITEDQLYNLDDYSFNELAQNNQKTFNNVLLVKDNKLFKTKYEEQFDNKDLFHNYCVDLKNRNVFENEMYKILVKKHHDLRPDQLIIDIPEHISFEVDIPILFKNGSTILFKDCDEIFSSKVISSFESSLRKVRIFTLTEITKYEIKEAITLCKKKLNITL